MRLRNAKLRERAERLERQTGALSVDRDRSVRAALLRSERCEEHGRELMHWQRLAEWHWAAAGQQEEARRSIVGRLILVRHEELRDRTEPVSVDLLVKWLSGAIDAQKRVKRQPDGWPPLEQFLHAGCSCSTVPTDGIACWQAQGLLFALPEDGTEGMDAR